MQPDTCAEMSCETSTATPLHLHVADAQGQYLPATPEQILQAAREVIILKLPHGALLNSPTAAQDYACTRLAALEHEVFAVFFLDSQLRLIAFKEMFHGTVNQASVYPREVVKQALRCNASQVILAHNHPSGLLNPSDADRMLTRQLSEALCLVGVKVIDHLIVGAGSVECYSFSNHGLL